MENLDHLDYRGHLESLEKLEEKVRRDIEDSLVYKVCLVQLDHLEIKAHLAQQVLMVSLALLAAGGHLV